MRIAMISEHASPLARLGPAEAGGQNVHVAALSRALAERGHDVTVYTRHEDPDQAHRVAMAPRVTVEHVPAGPPAPVPRDELLPLMPEFGAYLRDRWHTRPPDVVHAHFWTSGLAALMGAEPTGTPVLQTFHALGAEKARHQKEKDTSPPQRVGLERAVALRAAKVLATSTAEVDELVRMGVSRTSVTIVPCGVDTSVFNPHGPAADRGPNPRIIAAGRMVERKGLDTVIRALALVPHAELLIAGGPMRADLGADPEARRLRALAKELHVEGRAVFLGAVAHDRMPALFRSADVAVTVPWYEPFGIVPLEAMACGVPVIASAVGGHLDTVVDGCTGVHVRPRDPKALAFALRTLLGDPMRRWGLGTAGAERARSRYTWERVATATEAVYESVAAPEALKVVS